MMPRLVQPPAVQLVTNCRRSVRLGTDYDFLRHLIPKILFSGSLLAQTCLGEKSWELRFYPHLSELRTAMKVGGCAIHRGLPSPAWGWVKDRETIHLGGTKIASSKVDRLNCCIRRVGWRIDLENLVHGMDT